MGGTGGPQSRIALAAGLPGRGPGFDLSPPGPGAVPSSGACSFPSVGARDTRRVPVVLAPGPQAAVAVLRPPAFASVSARSPPSLAHVCDFRATGRVSLVLNVPLLLRP